MKRLLTRLEVANMLGVSRQTISNWVEDGVITKHVIKHSGRNVDMFDRETIEAILDDAQATQVSVEKMKAMRMEAEEEEERFTFRQLSQENKELDSIAFSAIQDIALAFVDFASCKMKERQAAILKLFVKGGSLDYIAWQYGLSKERIRQIVRSAARHLLDVRSFKDILDENEELRERNHEVAKSYEHTLTKLKEIEKKYYSLCDKLGLKESKDSGSLSVIDDKELNNTVILLNTKLVDTGISVRALNCLKSANIETIGDLVQCDRFYLLRFRNFGKKSLSEINDIVDSLGLSWGMDTEKIYHEYNEKLAKM